MSDAHKNFAYSLVATAPVPADTGTSLIVTAGQGGRFPTTPFNATVWPTAVQPLPTNAEIVTVTNVSTDTLTIVRLAEGSSVRSIVAGDQIAAVITNKTLVDMDGYFAPSNDKVLQPGTYQYVLDYYEIGSGLSTEIGSGSIMEISNV